MGQLDAAEAAKRYVGAEKPVQDYVVAWIEFVQGRYVDHWEVHTRKGAAVRFKQLKADQNTIDVTLSVMLRRWN